MLARKRGRTFSMNRMTAMIVEKCKITYVEYLCRKFTEASDSHVKKGE